MDQPERLRSVRTMLNALLANVKPDRRM